MHRTDRTGTTTPVASHYPVSCIGIRLKVDETVASSTAQRNPTLALCSDCPVSTLFACSWLWSSLWLCIWNTSAVAAMRLDRSPAAYNGHDECLCVDLVLFVGYHLSYPI